MALEIRPPTARVVGRVLTLLVVTLLAGFLRLVGPPSELSGGTMLLGFLLLAGFVSGELARGLRLPRITGYLTIGILFGPYVLGLVPRQVVGDFKLINDIALSAIALQAGGELRIAGVRDRLRSIVTITAFQTTITMAAVVLVIYVARDLLPFLADQPDPTVIAVALIFGLVAVAKSPATTIAVITEMHARGPLTDTVLSISVLKDVLILLLIAVILPLAAVLTEPLRGFDFAQLRQISASIVVSLLMGAAIGWLLVLYLRHIGRQRILFVLAVAFVVVELAHGLRLESESYILMSMAAGFVVQNASVQGAEFLGALEGVSLPLYALFFAVAGADLDLTVMPSVWQIGTLIILARMVFIYGSTYLGALASGALPVIRHYAWMGFLAKAGVTLGLANIVRDRFEPWGTQVAAIIIAMVAVNQLVGPALFRFALVRAGETSARRLVLARQTA